MGSVLTNVPSGGTLNVSTPESVLVFPVLVNTKLDLYDLKSPSVILPIETVVGVDCVLSKSSKVNS